MTLTRCAHRFGGEGTIVTLADGCACTAAHCVAAFDSRRGAWIVAADGSAWRVERRWSPAGRDLALLTAATPPARPRDVSWPRRPVVRPGLVVALVVWTGRRFARRRAVVRAVTATAFLADVAGPRGVRAGDSGGAVLAGDTLVGVITHRTGVSLTAQASASVRVARIDTPPVRTVLASLRARLA